MREHHKSYEIMTLSEAAKFIRVSENTRRTREAGSHSIPKGRPRMAISSACPGGVAFRQIGVKRKTEVGGERRNGQSAPGQRTGSTV